jgi:diguanylate cyclase (GGDEF)-like protein
MEPRPFRLGHDVASTALLEAVPVIGLAFVFLNRQLPHPTLAAVSLGLVMIFPLLRVPEEWKIVLSVAIGVFTALALVNLNGGIASPLRPLWLAVIVSAVLAEALVAVSVVVAGSSLVVVTFALVGGGLHSASVFAGALAILVVSVAVTRSHARTVDGLERQVTTDTLTGLRNRYALDRRIDEFFNVEQPRGALVYIDLDGFREINRTRGHTEADALLRAVGSALTRILPDDFVARVGGDEFVLLLDRGRDPLDIARHVLHVIAEAGPPGLQLSATAGVAYVPEDGTDPGEVLTAADLALRWGKADGKGRAVRYESQHVVRREVNADDIRGLWLEDRISIYVQPIVDLRLGRVRGYEALARFGLHGDKTPLDVLTTAQSFGLRPQLELACLRKSLRLLERRPEGTYLSVNLSPGLLELSVVQNALDAVPDLDGLVLELTEDTVIEDYDRLAGLLARHVGRGLKIAVDDFGAGQANLRHAWSILPAYLKLDRTLVYQLDNDPARRALVGSIVDYAEDVGASLIAEGVETTAELDALLKLGVRYVQGFRLGAPTPPWPVIDVDAVLAGQLALSTPSRYPELLTVSATESALAVQQRFAQNPRATDAVVQDVDGRVVGLLTRNRLLVTLGARYGSAVYGTRSALEIADSQFTSVRPGTSRDEMIAQAIYRDESRRYDPILLVDGDGRLLGKLTIQELLEPESGAPAPQEDRGAASSGYVSTKAPTLSPSGSRARPKKTTTTTSVAPPSR